MLKISAPARLLLFALVILTFFPSKVFVLDSSETVANDFFLDKFYMAVLIGAFFFATYKKYIKITISHFNFFILALIPVAISYLINMGDIIIKYRLLDVISEPIRYIAYFCILLLVFDILNKLTQLERNYVSKFFIRLIIYGQLLLLLLYISPFRDYYNLIYASKSIGLSAEDAAGYIISVYKFDGMFGNPNYAGFVYCVLITLIYSVRRFFLIRELIVLVGTLLILTVIGGSRTGFLVVTLQAVILSPILSTLFFIALFLIFGFDSLLSLNPKISSIYYWLHDGVTLVSYDIRDSLVHDSLQLIVDKPLIGYGISPIQITDNYYMLRVLRYGLIGFLIHLSIITLLLLNTLVKIKNIFIFFLPILIFIYTGAFVENIRLFFITNLAFCLYIHSEHSRFS